MMQKYTFGELLRGFREREGISQQELGNRLGVHRNTISAWERYEYLPDSREIILKLAGELSLDQTETDQILYAANRPLEYQTLKTELLSSSPLEPSTFPTLAARQGYIEGGNLQIFGGFIARMPTPVEAKEWRELGILLGKVKQFWVEGVLEKSVHVEAIIALGKETQPDQVDHPWARVLELPDQTNQILPPNKKIVDVFYEMQASLLILGEPGSSKTITLLELTRDLIGQIKTYQDFTQPIPVVFNLSSWIDKKQPLIDWLVSELTAKYQIPKRIGCPWLENHRLLPLLDGLDEVKAENRAACIEVINSFGEEFGLAGLAVCSRLKEYMDLPVRLKLNGAIRLQPLTPEQVDKYLAMVSSELNPLRTLLQRDNSLLELAQSPLMLNIMTLAYRDIEALTGGPTLETMEARHKHLFDTYIERMFKRKGKVEKPYADQQTVNWLTWLAQNMARHNQAIFLIERLQPSWLSTRTWHWFYIVTSRLIGTTIVGLIIGMNVGTLGIFSTELGKRLQFGLIAGIISGLSIGLIDRVRYHQSDENITAKKTPTVLKLTIYVFIIGVVNVLIGWLASLLTGTFIRTYGILSFGLIIGLLFGLRSSQQALTNDIQTVEALSWSWDRVLKGGGFGLIAGLLFGFIGLLFGQIIEGMSNLLSGLLINESFVLIFGLVNRLMGEPIDGLSFVLSYTMIFGSMGGLIGATFGGLSIRIVETTIIPNQGIWLSTKNAAFTGLIFWLSFGLIGILSFGLLFWLSGKVQFEILDDILRFGLRIGLPAVLWYGGLDVIQHFIIRFILYFNGSIPWNYIHFLDYTVERIFLRKVGGGYIFIHRLLLEHFTALDQNK